MASGKFEQLKGEEPYTAFRSIIRKLLHELLRLDSVELEKWKARLEFLTGNNSNVLIDFIPDFRTLLEEDSHEPLSLDSEVSTTRFNSLEINIRELTSPHISALLQDIFYLPDFILGPRLEIKRKEKLVTKNQTEP